MSKTCNRCQAEKPINEFGKHACRKDGLQEACKACRSTQRKAEYALLPAEAIMAHKAKCRAYGQANSERMKELSRAYVKANRVAHNERSQRWRLANPEKSKQVQAESQKRHVAKDKAAFLAKKQVWRDNNRVQMRANKLRRRARGGGYHPFTAAEISVLWHKTKGVCVYCRISLGFGPADASKYEIDHLHPLSKGGTNEMHNLQCICPSCNRKKSAKLPHVFAAQLGRLF